MRASWLENREVLGICERNYHVYCAMNSIPLNNTPMDSSADGDDNMELDHLAQDGELTGFSDGEKQRQKTMIPQNFQVAKFKIAWCSKTPVQEKEDEAS